MKCLTIFRGSLLENRHSLFEKKKESMRERVRESELSKQATRSIEKQSLITAYIGKQSVDSKRSSEKTGMRINDNGQRKECNIM